MQRTARFMAVLLILAGATFAGQGLGLIRSSSAMTDDLRWTVIGSAMVVVGVVLALRTRRRTRPLP
jgi:hypothetical protein